MTKVHVDYFTHPVCTGCWEVGKMLVKLQAELPDLEVEQWSLALPAGRRKAEELGVLEVPTMVIDGRERIVGVPQDLAALKARLVGARE